MRAPYISNLDPSDPTKIRKIEKRFQRKKLAKSLQVFFFRHFLPIMFVVGLMIGVALLAMQAGGAQ